MKQVIQPVTDAIRRFDAREVDKITEVVTYTRPQPLIKDISPFAPSSSERNDNLIRHRPSLGIRVCRSASGRHYHCCCAVRCHFGAPASTIIGARLEIRHMTQQTVCEIN